MESSAHSPRGTHGSITFHGKVAAMNEIWAAVPDLLGKYEVSNAGRVRSLSCRVPRGQGTYLLTGRVLRPSKAGKGYLKVQIGGRSRYVHRLVMEVFVGPCPAGMEVCHNNGDKTDNRLTNLRYDTSSNNNRDQAVHGTNANAVKTHCPRGHEYSEENTLNRKDGGRKCRTCMRDQSREAMRERTATPEGKAEAAAKMRAWRRKSGKISGQHIYGSRTHCTKGHEYTPENTILRIEGGRSKGRRCRACQAARKR